MKMMRRLLIALCLIGLTSSMALAATKTADLGGPVKISLDLQSIGPYKAVKENPTSLSYNVGGNTFTYQKYTGAIIANNTGNKVLLEVHQANTPQSLDTPIPQYSNKTGLEHLVEISDMMPSGKDVQRQTYYVDGHKGIAFAINRDQKGPIYLAAFSPDIKDGFGKTLVIIGSDFPLDTTKAIFESVKTQLVQDNTISQGGLGQGNTGQSSTSQVNTGMSNMGQTSAGQSSMGQGNMGMMNNMMNMMSNMMGMMNNMMSMQTGNMGQSNMGQSGMMMM